MNYQSEMTDKLDESLAKAQGSYKKPYANEDDGRGNKFANLSAILDSVREALSSNQLSFRQRIELQEDGSTLLRTILGHSSGQWTSSIARVIKKKTMRNDGNTLEIIKRQQALLILGVAPSQHDPIFFDDDGIEEHEIVLIEEIKNPKSEEKGITNVKHQSESCITSDQYKDILTEIGSRDHIARMLLEFYTIETIADLPRSQYFQALTKVRTIKDTEDKYLKRSR